MAIYYIFPRWFITRDERIEICSAFDQDGLEKLLEEDFDGCTASPLYSRGIGKRGERLETNDHKLITVIASRWEGTIEIFQKASGRTRGV